MTARVESTDGPGADVVRRLEQLAMSTTDVGITGEDGGPAGDHQPDGEPLAMIMAIHEFGAGVPAAPVLGTAATEARGQLEAAAAAACGAAAEHGPRAASEILGPILAEAMRTTIVAEDLVGTGQLRDALRWCHRGPA